ncbi:MAG: hypothetical protein ABI939_10160 [Anaerolineaceae bacterium]
MQPLEGHGLPHEPAPAEPRRLIPERPLLVRGVALLALALAAVFGLLGAARKAAWLGVLLAPPLALTAALATWAAAIHLTGGERFDDHPWV